jgi:hypothetical protein
MLKGATILETIPGVSKLGSGLSKCRHRTPTETLVRVFSKTWRRFANSWNTEEVLVAIPGNACSSDRGLAPDVGNTGDELDR